MIDGAGGIRALLGGNRDDRRGGVFGVLGSAHAATALAGMGLAGVLGGAAGVVPALCVHAAGLIVAGIMILTWAHA
ncbi:hypothetical protein ACIBI9_07830 [Nonomuraea sp. NPDC050451]|uniref:hypothetical protein n=1 Tax=Nonomuraea sp. NPDC050451 TaxID=3364364 RepID=UPI0037BA1ED3